jgi:hypothetical protein
MLFIVNLAMMKQEQSKRNENLIRMLSIFEHHLKGYNEYFNNDNYCLTYKVRRSFFSEIEEINVTMILKNNHHFFQSLTKSISTCESLKMYCRYFSIDKIEIVKPYNKKIQSVDLKSRITFEIFSTK